jgi:hypothetical protein
MLSERLYRRRETLLHNPFDPRTEVSADAKRIVANLWVLFVLLPIVTAILLALAGILK